MTPITGAALGAALGFFALAGQWPVIATVVAAFGITLSAQKPRTTSRFRPIVLLGVGMCTGGALAALVSGLPQVSLGLPRQEVSAVEGVLLADSSMSRRATILSLRPTRVESASSAAAGLSERAPGLTVVVSGGRSMPAGTRLRIDPIRFAQPEQPLAHRGTAGASETDGASERELLAFADAEAVRRLAPPSGLARIRACIRSAVLEVCRGAGEGAGELLCALYMGSTDGLGLRVKSLFRQAGASHILALSGMHLGVLMMVVLLLLRPLIGLRFGSIVAVLVGVVYLLIVGPRPSLVRGVLMLGIGVGLRLGDRRVVLLDLLGLAFLAQLMLTPSAATTVSFKLSYLALAGIAIVAPELERTLRPWLPRAVGMPISAGVGAQLATAPVVMASFGVIAPIGVVSAVALGPLVLVLMVAGIPLLLVHELGAAIPVAQLLRPLYLAIENAAWFFAAAPRLESPSPQALWAIAAIACGGCGLLRMLRRRAVEHAIVARCA